MKRAHIVYGSAWMMALTIESGFFVGEHMEVNTGDIPWFTIRCSLLFALLVVTVSCHAWSFWHSVQNERRKRRSFLVFPAVLIPLSSLYGFEIGRTQSSNLDSVLGRSVEVSARVAFISHQHSQVMGLDINAIGVEQGLAGGGMQTRWIPCHASALWHRRQSGTLSVLSNRSSPSATEASGSFVLRGVFISLPLSANTTTPFGIGKSYGFRGQLLGNNRDQSIWAQVRQAIDEKVQTFGQNQIAVGDLIESIVFGGGATNPVVKQQFLDAGLLHVLVASGANVVLLESTFGRCVRPLWRFLRLPGWAWFGVLLSSIWGYVGLCGFDASIVRAGWMASYRTVGDFLGRRSSTTGGLSFCACAMAVVRPGQLLTLSALLSFLATVAIQQAQSHAGRRVRRVPETIWHKLSSLMVHQILRGLRITLMIELMILPITLSTFGQFTPYALISNVVVEPLLFLLLPVAALWVVLAMVGSGGPFHVVSEWLYVVTVYMMHVLLWFVQFVSTLPYALTVLPKPPILWVVAYYFVAGFVIVLWRRRNSARDTNMLQQIVL